MTYPNDIPNNTDTWKSNSALYPVITEVINNKWLLFIFEKRNVDYELTNYDAIIKIGKQDFIDIIDIKNTRLSGKNSVTNVPHILSSKVL